MAFEMNAARMKKCMDGGKSRAQCMKEVYPERGGGKKADKSSGKKGKKMPAKFSRY
jgi:hypothetical protein